MNTSVLNSDSLRPTQPQQSQPQPQQHVKLFMFPSSIEFDGGRVSIFPYKGSLLLMLSVIAKMLMERWLTLHSLRIYLGALPYIYIYTHTVYIYTYIYACPYSTVCSMYIYIYGFIIIYIYILFYFFEGGGGSLFNLHQDPDASGPWHMWRRDLSSGS